MIAQLYRLGLCLIAPITIAAAFLFVGLGLLYALLTFSWIGARRRDAAIMVWSRILLLILGVRLESKGAPPPRPCADRGSGAGSEEIASLLLINHTSWLDVFAIAAVVPARFVSKAEIRRWPVFGWLAIVLGTVFVERGRRHAVLRTNQTVTERLRAGQLIGVFPEGTTTDGARIFPFHANLLQPAIDLAAPMRPVGLRFTQGGEFSRAAMYIGDMNLFQSLWRVATAPHLGVELHWLEPIDPPPSTRHQAARAARAAIADALQVPMEDRPPQGELAGSSDSDDPEPGARSAAAG